MSKNYSPGEDPNVDAAAPDVHLAPMSTVAEIEAALPELSPEELRRVEVLLHQLQQRQSTALPKNPRLQALDALQARLALDGQKADAWAAVADDSFGYQWAVQPARRADGP